VKHLETKVCTGCGIEKPLSDFYNSKSTKDGKTYKCKDCRKKYNAWFRSTPEGICQQIKGRNGFFKDHPFVITQEEFVEWYKNTPRECVYCGIKESELYLWKEIVGGRFKRLTVDCADNDKGYVKGNLVLACDKCNVMKGDVLTYDDMLYVGQRFVRPKWEAVKERSVKHEL